MKQAGVPLPLPLPIGTNPVGPFCIVASVVGQPTLLYCRIKYRIWTSNTHARKGRMSHQIHELAPTIVMMVHPEGSQVPINAETGQVPISDSGHAQN
jgi:hypothetical protein